MIPFLNLSRLHESISAEIDDAVARVISTSGFVGGAEVASFEEEFGAAHQLGRGAGCGSGTDALALALRALGVGPGDEVVVPAMTFVATAEAAVHVGATPILADVDPETLLLSRDTVAAVRTSRTKAVIPVHLYGHVVPFEEIIEWSGDGLSVVEDCAQAHLATWQGTPVGTYGDAACFSFYPSKNLGAMGDGGMVLSRHEDLIAEVRRLRDHGRTTKYLHDAAGWCSRLDGLQAAILRAKLTHLREWTSARQELAEEYRELVEEYLVPWTEGAVHHLLVSRVADRSVIQEHLNSNGVQTGIHYPVALSHQPWLARPDRSLPVAEQAAEEVLSLPIDPLMTSTEVQRVCEAFYAGIGNPE